MIELYRCKGCGYLHVGPAPEKCPVCGAPQSFFLPHERPADLTGTQTLANLQAAFSGESQANRRYTLFSQIASQEGNAEAVDAFEHAAAEETAHALGHLAYMNAYGLTSENLATAAEGEDYEFAQMYPEFARVAEEEGYPEIAFYFRSVGNYERKHRDAYKKVQEQGD